MHRNKVSKYKALLLAFIEHQYHECHLWPNKQQLYKPAAAFGQKTPKNSVSWKFETFPIHRSKLTESVFNIFAPKGLRWPMPLFAND